MFSKKCAICKRKATITKVLPVYGYTTDQKRHFCTEKHADAFENAHKEALEQHVPGCRTCYK